MRSAPYTSAERVTAATRERGTTMTASAEQRRRWRRRYWDRKARGYDRQMKFADRVLFGDTRRWICSQAAGQVLEVAIGTGLNLQHYPTDVALTGIELSPAISRSRSTGLVSWAGSSACGSATPRNSDSTTSRSTPWYARSRCAPYQITVARCRRWCGCCVPA